MFIESDMFAFFQLPAAHATTRTFSAITATDLPIIVWFLALENDIRNG
jgi:hypothetical protein